MQQSLSRAAVAAIAMAAPQAIEMCMADNSGRM